MRPRNHRHIPPNAKINLNNLIQKLEFEKNQKNNSNEKIKSSNSNNQINKISKYKLTVTSNNNIIRFQNQEMRTPFTIIIMENDIKECELLMRLNGITQYTIEKCESNNENNIIKSDNYKDIKDNNKKNIDEFSLNPSLLLHNKNINEKFNFNIKKSRDIKINQSINKINNISLLLHK